MSAEYGNHTMPAAAVVELWPVDAPEHKSLHQKLVHQALLLSSVRDAIIVTDENYRITYWNEMSSSLYGWTAEEALGQTVPDLLRTIVPGTTREHAIQKMLRDGYYDDDVIYRGKNGEVIYTHVHAQVLRDEAGKFRGIVSTLRDYTARKRTEDALRRSEERHAFLLRLSDGIRPLTNAEDIQRTVAHLLLQHLHVARISFTTCDEEDLNAWIHQEESRDGTAILVKHYRYEDFPTHVSILRSGQPYAVEDMTSTSLLTPQERERFLAMGARSQIAVPLIKGGKLVACHSVRQDTPRRWTNEEIALVQEAAERTWVAIEHTRAQEALRLSEKRAQELARELDRRNRFITDFFINISHEFKTPISILLLGIDLLDKKAAQLAGGAVQIMKSTAVMRQNAYRLSRLVSNLLDITKLEAGFMEPTWEKKDIVEWLGYLVKSAELYATQRGLTLTYACDADTKLMITDGFLFDRILLNLLSNAIKHTPSGGRIDVACHVEQGKIQVSVSDTGEGIPEEKKEIIFDRFSQVNTSMTRTSGGSGIGLALTKSLVCLLGGSIAFESTLGVGSTFTVELPVLQMDVAGKHVEKKGMELDKRIQMEMADIQ